MPNPPSLQTPKPQVTRRIHNTSWAKTLLEDCEELPLTLRVVDGLWGQDEIVLGVPEVCKRLPVSTEVAAVLRRAILGVEANVGRREAGQDLLILRNDQQLDGSIWTEIAVKHTIQ